MPIYSYLCQTCGITSDEFFFKHSDKTPTHPCASCGSLAVATATVAHVAGRHVNKDSVRVPGEKLSMSVDGFKVVDTPKHIKKMFRKDGKPIRYKKKGA